MKGKYATGFAYVPSTHDGLTVVAEPEPPVHQHVKRMWVVLDESPAWEAFVLCGEDEQPLRWNGWLACPTFTREVAEKVADFINQQDNADVVESSHFVWSRDYLIEYAWDCEVIRDEDEAKYDRTVHRPDKFGRYAIGAWAWVWYEAPTPSCRKCGWSQVGWADGDACPDCAEPFDWAGDV